MDEKTGLRSDSRSALHEAVEELRRTPTVSLVIPARNEARNIPWVLERMPSVVDEVILVDASTDGTAEVARQLRPDVVVVVDSGSGKGAALRLGFAQASGDYIVMLDADGSMDPLEIPRYVGLLNQGFDLVKGSRQLEGGHSDDLTLFRHLGNNGLRILSNRLYSAHFTDLCYGYMAFSRSALDAIAPSANGFDIEAELILRAKSLGLQITEVPTYETVRRYGASNLNAIRDGLLILRRILRERNLSDSDHPAVRPATVRTEPDLGAPTRESSLVIDE